MDSYTKMGLICARMQTCPEEKDDSSYLYGYFMQEAVAVTTAIQEEILQEMGIGGLMLPLY